MLPAFPSFLYRSLRRTHQRSGYRPGFLSHHNGTENTKEYKAKPSLQSTKPPVNHKESKPANDQNFYVKDSHHLSLITPYTLFLLACLPLFSSCEKVIDLNLKESDKQIVIEGTISYNTNMAPEVRISQTKAFENDNTFSGVSGAAVTVQASNGAVYTFGEEAAGIYRNYDFSGQLDSTYTLTVQFNGKTYTSVSHLPAQVVTLDSLWAEGLVFGGSTNIAIYPKYDDPKGLGNNYRLVEYANDTLVRKVFPQNDEFSDGNTVTRPLINPDSDLERGDSITVELQCIDAGVYKYWYSLDAAATGNNQSATPTNPVTNISGGALGYFSAYSATRYSFRIP